MPLFTKNGTTILFVHIPKTGGTSVAKFFEQNGFSVRWLQFSYPNIAKRESSPQHRTAAEVQEYIKKESVNYESAFVFVRNPLDRLISEYFFQLRRRKLIYRLLGLPAKVNFQKSLIIKKIGIWVFCCWVDTVFRLHNKNPVIFDNHITPQIEFLSEDVRVFKYENNYQDFISYMRELDSRYEFKINFSDIPHYAKGTNKVDMKIPEKTLARIFNFYRADFERFYPEICINKL